MSRKRRPLRPDERVTALSTQTELGPWVRSDRVNTRPESNWLANFVPILVLAVVGIAVVPFLSAIPWGGRTLIALMEHGQQEDGTIVLPACLTPFGAPAVLPAAR